MRGLIVGYRQSKLRPVKGGCALVKSSTATLACQRTCLSTHTQDDDDCLEAGYRPPNPKMAKLQWQPYGLPRASPVWTVQILPFSYGADTELLRTRIEMVNPMQNMTANTPLIRDASVMAFGLGGTPESGNTIKFINKYTATP